MKFQVLVSTMNQKDYALLEKMNINSDVVVVNQCDKESEETTEYNGYTVKWINTTERGLSRSRNMAIQNATADICILSDDDEVFDDDYAKTITETFVENPDVSLIRFKLEGIERKYKTYPTEKLKIGYAGSMHISSVEIAFRLKDIKDNNLSFDTNIGAGTDFLMGEENAFLFGCLRKNLKIVFVPKAIAKLHLGVSTWFDGYNEQYFIGRGAALAAMKTPITSVLIVLWALKKRSLYIDKLTVIQAIKFMQKGKRLYLKRVRGENNDT